MVLVAIGVAVIWPLFRLSARIRSAPRITALIDWLALMGTLQVVLWPMRVSGQWALSRLLALDWAFAAWGLIVGGIIALGVTRRPPATDRAGSRLMLGRRWFWMIICIALSVVGPLLAVVIERAPEFLASDEAELFLWSPIAMVWSMSGRTLDHPTDTEWLRLTFVTFAGLCLWFGVVLLPQVKRDRRRGERRRGKSSGTDQSPRISPQPD